MTTETAPQSASNLADTGTAGADIAPPPSISQTQTVVTVLTEGIGHVRHQVRALHEDADALHQRSHFTEWAVRTSQRGRSSPTDLLGELAQLGFAWRDLARMVGVTVQAIQKWRRGSGTSGENRHKIASLLAACDLVADHYGIHEVASWFEMPLLPGVPVAPIELWESGQPDLVFEYASGHTDPDQILTTWDPQWRDRYRSDFEVFRAGDGQLSIRQKGQ